MDNVEKFFLIGAAGCGKTTLGQGVADVLQLSFFDTDAITLERFSMERGRGILDFSLAASAQRQQAKIISELVEVPGPAIISTGAEVALIPECANIMEQAGVMIHIKRNVNAIIADLKANKPKRLIVKDLNSNEEIDMEKETIKLYSRELPAYARLTHLSLVNDGTVSEAVKKLTFIVRALL